jgi:hypothetical protein
MNMKNNEAEPHIKPRDAHAAGADNDAQNSWQSELFKPPASAAERREMLKLAQDASGAGKQPDALDFTADHLKRVVEHSIGHTNLGTKVPDDAAHLPALRLISASNVPLLAASGWSRWDLCPTKSSSSRSMTLLISCLARAFISKSYTASLTLSSFPKDQSALLSVRGWVMMAQIILLTLSVGAIPSVLCTMTGPLAKSSIKRSRMYFMTKLVSRVLTILRYLYCRANRQIMPDAVSAQMKVTDSAQQIVTSVSATNSGV